MIRKPEVDVMHFLESLEIRNVQLRGDEAQFSCPFDGHAHGDQTPSASMNVKTTQWKCWGCKRAGNAVSFVEEHEGVSPMQAMEWLEDAYGGGFREPRSTLLEEIETSWHQVKAAARAPETVLPESTLQQFAIDWRVVSKRWDEAPDCLRYLVKRGFATDTLERYDVGYDPLSDRLTLPVRNEHGGLVGFKGRTWRPEIKQRYKVLGDKPDAGYRRYEFPTYETGQVVWGLDSSCGDSKIVVEGELNALMMRQMGYQQAVGLSGSDLTDAQAILLRRNAEEVTFIFDSDTAGKIGQAKAISKVEPYIPTFVVPDHNNDPAASTPEELAELLARRFSTFTIAI